MLRERNNSGCYRAKAYFIFVLNLCLVVSCRSQSNDEKIKNTTEELLAFINKKDYKSVQSILSTLGTADTSMEVVVHKVDRVNYLIDKYYSGQTDSLKSYSAEKLDESSRLKVTIPLFKGYDTATGMKQANLVLFFGPSQIIPLDQIEDFEFEANYDLDKRDELMRTNQLLEWDK